MSLLHLIAKLREYPVVSIETLFLSRLNHPGDQYCCVCILYMPISKHVLAMGACPKSFGWLGAELDSFRNCFGITWQET